MKQRQFTYYACDFETTVFKGQERTDVWAAACVPLYSEEVSIFNSIEQQWDFFLAQKGNLCCYYHNLKFDGSFWLDYFLTVKHYKQAVIHTGPEEHNVKWIQDKSMVNNTFKYSVSEMGQWYTITIKINNRIIQLRDSLKLLPFSIKRIGESFATKHKKLDMEYEGFRYPGCVITDEEKHYISNDVLVLKEALEIMHDQGHKSLTIGSSCLKEYQKVYSSNELKELFPNLYEFPLDKSKYGSENAGNYIRRSYKGGWCYVAKGKENKEYHNGTTADVNSLYPSMMSSESGNYFPIGLPTFWHGDYIPDEAMRPDRYFFIRIRTKFFLRKDYLPCIQIKNSLNYKATQWLETSNIYDKETGKYYSQYVDMFGELHEADIELTLTQTDFALIKEHYILADTVILDGCYFKSRIGLFDDYINRWKKIKLESKGAMRELAKLFLNNLYGKFATNTNSSFKYAYVKEDNTIGFYTVLENEKKPGYIPIGAAITSYARNFTIRAAQMNYHGVDNPGFIYADTDSIHCDLSPEDLQGIQVHDKNFCCWKLESCWDYGIFARQKTYIEHVVMENLKPIDHPYYNVKCAGMPEHCKDLFLESVTHDVFTDEEKEKLDDDEKEFISHDRTLDDFKIGLVIPGKLMPKRIHGGVLLVNTTYEMRE